MVWSFYGRGEELDKVDAILARSRWSFVRVTGRRRIGKTTLVQHALADRQTPVLYCQIPDSAPAGVLVAFRDALETFRIDPSVVAPPVSLSDMANAVGALVRRGYVVVLDEFQYFHRTQLAEFCSHLQRVVDALTHDAANVSGVLFVLGSIHTEMVAILEDRGAPLYGRATDVMELDHLDIAAVREILRAHADESPERLLFLWNLFEGVPKFYRDCFEQGVLGESREELLRTIFFQSSAPLRGEAENWFLHELRGRYDLVLKYIATHPGASNGEVESHAQSVGDANADQVGGYIKILLERYRMIEKRQPIFAKEKARRSRYYIRDNFLRSWLGALAPSVAAVNFRPIDELVSRANERLMEAEGYGLERLVAALYAERSRKGLPGFTLTRRIDGYWDKAGTEIDFVAVDEEGRRIRFGFCKRDPAKLAPSLHDCDAHLARFLAAQRQYAVYQVEKVAIAPRLDSVVREAIAARTGWQAQDLVDLVDGIE